MNRRILIQVTAPAVVIGLILFATGVYGAWHVNRLQKNLASILSQNVSSMDAAQYLETSVRQLRFHSFLYLIDPDPALARSVQNDDLLFEAALVKARQSAHTSEEFAYLRELEEGYERYQREFDAEKLSVEKNGPRFDFRKLAEAHPLRHLLVPCREFSRVNEEMMNQTARESERNSWRLQAALFVLGVGGPISGLIAGYGMARGLSRSIYRLSVQVRDMALHLDRDVASVQVSAGGSLEYLDEQLNYVVHRVAEATERFQRQQREMLRAQQLAAVGQLAASVAHEIRNPLTSIKLLVEAALHPSRPRPFTAENLRVVRSEVLRLERTVQSFLDFARPPSLQRRASDLRDVLAQAVELVRVRARQQRVALMILAPEGPVPGLVDEDQLRTVLVNLFMNALDAMPRGGRLEVMLCTTDCGATLSVSDGGGGIPPEVLEQLFTPFMSTKPTGSGLGLSISRRIIEEHGGSLTAENRPEGGALFSIFLPDEGSVSHADAAGHR